MGGDNSETNFVLLTGKEHYEAHSLLAKIYPDHYGIQFAWWNMCITRDSKGREYLVSPEEYEEARISFSKAQSKKKITYFSLRENREKHSKSLIKYFELSESKNRLKEILNTPEVKQKMSNKRKEYFNNPENSKRFKEIQNSAKTIEKRKKAARKAPIWHEPMYSELYCLWLDSDKPKYGKFSTIAIRNGYPKIDYKGLVEYDFFKKT